MGGVGYLPVLAGVSTRGRHGEGGEAVWHAVVVVVEGDVGGVGGGVETVEGVGVEEGHG